MTQREQGESALAEVRVTTAAFATEGERLGLESANADGDYISVIEREREEAMSHPTDCNVDECIDCGIRDCRFHEPLHYHHDGCPMGCSDSR
jgi:hypothetical protein